MHLVETTESKLTTRVTVSFNSTSPDGLAENKSLTLNADDLPDSLGSLLWSGRGRQRSGRTVGGGSQVAETEPKTFGKELKQRRAALDRLQEREQLAKSSR
jgi:hypothetical protein